MFGETWINECPRLHEIYKNVLTKLVSVAVLEDSMQNLWRYIGQCIVDEKNYRNLSLYVLRRDLNALNP